MALIRTALFTLLVPGTVAGLVPLLLQRAEPAGWSLPLAGYPAAGWAPLLTGAALYLWCAWDFATAGRGTPSPTHPPVALVVRGPYRLSRNPMYVGVTLALLGQALLWSSPAVLAYGLAVLAGFHVRVVRYEEPVLRGTFGAAYEVYAAQVPRWI